MTMMRPATVLLVIVSAGPGPAHSSPGQPPRLEYHGLVYDLDLTSGRNRVVAQLRSPSESLIAETASPGLVRILQTALCLGSDIALEYEPAEKNRIVSARLARSGRSGNGQVLELGFDEGRQVMEAKVRWGGGDVVVGTKDERAQAILQCAFQEDRPVGELEYEPGSRSLERVKLTILR